MNAAKDSHDDPGSHARPDEATRRRRSDFERAAELTDSGVRARPSTLGSAEVEDQLERLDHVDRLALVGTYTASVVHELSNPTTFVLTNLALVREQLPGLTATARVLEQALALLPSDQAAALRRQLPDGHGDATAEQVGEMIRDSYEGIERITEMIQYLRTYVRQDRRSTDVSLADVVQDALRFMDRRIRERAGLKLDLEPVPTVVGEPVRLSQVVMNLLANAIQAIEPGHASDNLITVRLTSNGHRIFLSVEDTGSGMTEEVRRRAFDPFFTTKRRGEGTGLGLALCLRIVDEHGGTMTCASELGLGSRFVIALPC